MQQWCCHSDCNVNMLSHEKITWHIETCGLEKKFHSCHSQTHSIPEIPGTIPGKTQFHLNSAEMAGEFPEFPKNQWRRVKTSMWGKDSCITYLPDCVLYESSWLTSVVLKRFITYIIMLYDIWLMSHVCEWLPPKFRSKPCTAAASMTKPD